MPYPPPPRTPSGPRRRTLLASAAGAALLAGCSSGSGGDEENTSGSMSATARVRARAARDSSGLAERYDAVITAYPALAERLAPLRAEIVRHAEAFGGSVAKPSTGNAGSEESAGTGASASASAGTASPSASPSGTGTGTAVPGTEQEALVELAAAERALADRRTTALLDVPGEPARLLASVAAAGAAHAYLLTEGAR
ncbi:hypothetical protein [Streptomyces pseudovenezuelae]|uniref:Lipoprotein n=1 Tax=Streptomyces pseudovenezuelae TaxID=67350 RepID=A0ABT6M047_9ACTN|nr:hypothetical protein [Streptomyces pseudovenezuelae]MDH6221925.1 hypothetical protein [Streptomyces pseudovenezuelae]